MATALAFPVLMSVDNHCDFVWFQHAAMIWNCLYITGPLWGESVIYKHDIQLMWSTHMHLTSLGAIGRLIPTGKKWWLTIEFCQRVARGLLTWWRHQMGTFSALPALCERNPPVTGGFTPSERSVTRSVDVFFDLCLNKRLRKQSRCWWFEVTSCLLWNHCNEYFQGPYIDIDIDFPQLWGKTLPQVGWFHSIGGQRIWITQA